MLGTPVRLSRVTWQVPVPTALPVLMQAMAPAVSAAPVPTMLVEASADAARLQAMVVPGTSFPSGATVQLLDSRLQAVGAGVVA